MTVWSEIIAASPTNPFFYISKGKTEGKTTTDGSASEKKNQDLFPISIARFSFNYVFLKKRKLIKIYIKVDNDDYIFFLI